MDWSMFFAGWQPVWRTLIVGTAAYACLVFLLRISGKRTLSKMNAFDFVITVAFGSTLATILLSKQVSLAQGVVALGLLILLQFINTFAAVRFPAYQKLLKAAPTLLLYKGEFQRSAMHRQRVTEAEILAAMRQHGVNDPAEVAAVVLETEGSLSILTSDDETSTDLSRLGLS